MRLKKEILSLACILTDSEKLDYSKSMAEAITAKARAEDSLKSFNTQTKAEIQSLQANINLYADKINTGKEYRPIECKIQYDYDNKEKTWIRADTGEIAKTDIIEESELQEEIVLHEKR